MTNVDLQIKPKFAFRYYLKNEKPVDLLEFTESLKAIQDEYTEYAKSIGLEIANSKLYILKVQEGSIICDLVEYFSAGLLPFAEGANTICDFYTHIKGTFDYLSQKSNKRPDNLSRQTLSNFKKIVQPITADRGAKIEFSVIEGNVTYNNCNFLASSHDANAAQNIANAEAEKLKEVSTENSVFERVVLRITQLNSEKKQADRGIIESISKQPRKIIFRDNDKEVFTSSDDNPFRYFYLVDAQKLISQNRVIAYDILKVHDRFEE